MEISYHWHNLDVSDAIKDYSDKKIDKILVHFNNIVSAIVRFRVEKINHIVELTINADGAQLVAEEKAEDMYAAIDLCEKKMIKQIEKHKGKQRAHRV